MGVTIRNPSDKEPNYESVESDDRLSRVRLHRFVRAVALVRRTQTTDSFATIARLGMRTTLTVFLLK